MDLYDEKIYSENSNSTVADKLKRKLMIIAGDMDENVHPASSLDLVDKLIKANKDFELLMIPNADHTLVGHGYFIRKMLEFSRREPDWENSTQRI